MPTIWRASAGAVAAVIVLAACHNTESSPDGARGSATDSPTGSGQCAAREVGVVDVGSVLVPGPGNGLPPSTAPGVALVIVGVVLDASCRPVAEASVDVWHTDAMGEYGPTDDECCYYEGTVRTDLHGRFRVETIRPGRYPGTQSPPAHIHMDIQHGSGGLTTELVFVRDPGVPATAAEGTVPVALRQIGVVEQSWYGETTLVLEP